MYERSAVFSRIPNILRTTVRYSASHISAGQAYTRILAAALWYGVINQRHDLENEYAYHTCIPVIYIWTEDRTRGHSLKLKKNRFRTELRQHFFSERVINTWNKLDKDAVCASSLNSFKQHFQKLYQDGSFHRLIWYVISLIVHYMYNMSLLVSDCHWNSFLGI